MVDLPAEAPALTSAAARILLAILADPEHDEGRRANAGSSCCHDRPHHEEVSREYDPAA